MQEQVTNFLAGVGAQAVELQTGAEQDTGVTGTKWLLAVSLAALPAPFCPSPSSLGSPN